TVMTESVGQQPEPLGLGVAKNEPERPLARGVVPAPACHAFPFPNQVPAVKARGVAWRGRRGVWYGAAAYGDYRCTAEFPLPALARQQGRAVLRPLRAACRAHARGGGAAREGGRGARGSSAGAAGPEGPCPADRALYGAQSPRERGRPDSPPRRRPPLPGERRSDPRDQVEGDLRQPGGRDRPLRGRRERDRGCGARVQLTRRGRPPPTPCSSSAPSSSSPSRSTS